MGFTAIEEACRRGQTRILERLRPDPSRDDFDDLYRDPSNGAIIEVLGRFALPKKISAVIHSQAFWLAKSSLRDPALL